MIDDVVLNKKEMFLWISGGIGFAKPAGLRIRLDAEGPQGGFAIRPISHPLKSG